MKTREARAGQLSLTQITVLDHLNISLTVMIRDRIHLLNTPLTL